MSRLSFPPLLLLLAVVASPLPATTEREPATDYYLSILHDGAYRVGHDLLNAESPLSSIPSDRLALTLAGAPVPIWVDDGGDGTFDPGDAFEFVGRHLAGEVSYYNEHSPYNVYRLGFAIAGGARMERGTAPDSAAPPVPLRARRHFENDLLMVRFRQRAGSPSQETWFWERLTFLRDEPFETRIELDGLGTGPAMLEGELRGWSRVRNPMVDDPEHQVDIVVNGTKIGSGRWDGQEFHRVAIDPLPAELLAPETTVQFAVPRRLTPGDDEGEGDPRVDLSLLNWFEIDYPHTGTVSGQTAVRLPGDTLRSATLTTTDAGRLVAFDSLGRRWIAAEGSGPAAVTIVADEADLELVAVADDSFHDVVDVRADRPSSWRSGDHRADYLMIAHSSLLEGTRRLAEFHRDRGLDVEVIDVQDLYDEFNHGVVSPAAIRDFLDFAYREWSGPAARFVLLVGDASWDIDGRSLLDENYSDWSFQEREATREGFLKNKSTPYSGGPRDRGLVPTGSYTSAEGHAASDNYFVALEEDGVQPVMAIGRFPVVEPAELDAIVDKTIRYIEESGVGPWRRRILWITNEHESVKKRADILAADRTAEGFHGLKVYPRPKERSNEQHQQTLIDAFDDGQLLVYFHGHGGRYIWRTGATDYRKNRDLFNLEHLDQLAPNPRLPIILSMTCYSAPFDHPLADSIGEKFLRLPESGAVAVFAASWRNSPAHDLSQALVQELTRRQSVGEAILAAKRVTRRPDMVQTYNLLGDPAVPVAAPQYRLELKVDSAADGVRVLASMPDVADGFNGRAIVDWLAEDGSVLASEEIQVDGSSFEATFGSEATAAAALNVYAWDAERGVDAIGAFSWPEPEAAAPTAGAGSR